MNKIIKFIKDNKLIFDILNVILGIIILILCILLFVIPITLLHIGIITMVAGTMNILNGLRRGSKEVISKNALNLSIIFGVAILVFGFMIVIIR